MLQIRQTFEIESSTDNEKISSKYIVFHGIGLKDVVKNLNMQSEIFKKMVFLGKLFRIMSSQIADTLQTAKCHVQARHSMDHATKM
jgi:hypothetical protein